MKKVLIKLLIFIGLFLGVDFMAGAFIGHFYTTSKNINLRDANYGFLGQPAEDILIFGSSEMSHSLESGRIADKTGLSTYNLACDSCGIYYQFPLLETVLDYHIPKVIVLSSVSIKKEDSKYVSKMYPFYSDNRYVKSTIDTLLPYEYLKLALQGYIYNSKLIRVFDGRADNLNGYAPLSPEKSVMKHSKFTEPPRGRKYKISSASESYFRKLIEKAISAGTKVYVCLSPVYEEINSEYHKKVISTINDTGAKVIDLSKAPSFMEHKELFYDRVHLNDDGAKVMTDAVLEVLKADGVY